MNLVGYPTPGKSKARMLVEAFCAGAGGEVVHEIPARLLPGAPVFYGVTAATTHLFEQAKAEGRDWYYIDNAYFDSCREVYFRVTRNRLQHAGSGESDGRRFEALGIPIKPWRGEGRHVVVCPQSDEFMRLCARYRGSWLDDTLRALRAATRREIRVRPWARDKAASYASLPGDLAGAHALVTYSSAAAISAVLSGVPAFVDAADSIARPVCLNALLLIEEPELADRREAWARVVADNQWTVAEMKSGLAWNMIQEAALA